LKNNNHFVFSSGTIADDFGQLEPGHFYHYINDGQWSLHQLLAYVLNFTGPAQVQVTSFSLSETAIRFFVNLLDEGLITSLDCLFDLSTKKNKMDLLFFAKNVTSRVFIASNHAKLIAVKSKSQNVFINSSANLTVNRRHESGIVITETSLAKAYAKGIDKIFEGAILLTFEP